MPRAAIVFQMRIFRQEIDDEEKNHTRDEIDAQGMNVPGALPFHEFVRQPPRFEEKETEGFQKPRVEVKKGVGRIRQERPEGTMIIDRRLAALRAEGTGEGGATIFAMGQRRPDFPFPAKPFSAWPTTELRDRGIAENERRRFVRHRPQIIQGAD